MLLVLFLDYVACCYCLHISALMAHCSNDCSSINFIYRRNYGCKLPKPYTPSEFSWLFNVFDQLNLKFTISFCEILTQNT